MTDNAYSLVRLEPDSPRKPFDCSKPDLNEFFFEDSASHSRQLLAVTYALETEADTAAYSSVLNDSIRAGDTTRSRLKRILGKMNPRKRGYRSHPAVKIGRFAVSNNYKRNGIGTMLMDYIKGWFVDNNKTGCRYITVDANNEAPTIAFYKKNGFDFLTLGDEGHERRLMYYDLLNIVEPE